MKRGGKKGHDCGKEKGREVSCGGSEQIYQRRGLLDLEGTHRVPLAHGSSRDHGDTRSRALQRTSSCLLLQWTSPNAKGTSRSAGQRWSPRGQHKTCECSFESSPEALAGTVTEKRSGACGRGELAVIGKGGGHHERNVISGISISTHRKDNPCVLYWVGIPPPSTLQILFLLWLQSLPQPLKYIPF